MKRGRAGIQEPPAPAPTAHAFIRVSGVCEATFYRRVDELARELGLPLERDEHGRWRASEAADATKTSPQEHVRSARPPQQGRHRTRRTRR